MLNINFGWRFQCMLANAVVPVVFVEIIHVQL